MPDTTPLIRSLADVLADLERDAGLSPTRRRDLRSAVRRFCALLCRDRRGFVVWPIEVETRP